MRERIGEILKRKTDTIHALGPDASVSEAVHMMNEANIGAVFVLDPEEHLIGIFTERDVLRRVIDGRMDYEGTRLEDVMTNRVATVGPTATVEEALRTVNAIGCRHLPVVDGERVMGMISIRDLTNSLVAVREEEIAQLTEYISGGYGSRAG
ncbi:MAG TPA: CBS domain-containing protein [Gammaproteobacteria bacterium]|nr:CBS domain-containing protein [Gammaproteobacteria bacterium]